MPEKPTVLYRVDPRLVHATLMNAWVPALSAEWIIVADESVEKNERQRTILEMSAMDAVEVVFTSETRVAAAMQSIVVDRPAIVLFSSLESALAALRFGLAFDELNIGHVPSASNRAEVHPSVHLGESDYAVITAIEGRGVRVIVQPLPDDERRTPHGERVLSVPSAPAMPVEEEEEEEEGSETFVRGQLTVVNERGLHLRAAHVLARLAGSLKAEIEIGREGAMVNAKSLLGLTTLGAARGSKLDVVVSGPGAREAFERIQALFESGFDEGVA